MGARGRHRHQPNLGNVLDAPLEGKWAPPAQQRYFSDYKKAGFKSVRVPVRWDQHTSKAPPYLIDTTFLDRVEQVIDWSLGQNLSTIVNTHHDDWLDGAANDTAFDVQLDRLVSIWTQVATRLSSKDQRLLAFEVGLDRVRAHARVGTHADRCLLH